MANGCNLIVFADLVHPDENYDRISRALSSLGNVVKLGSMLWFVDASSGPVAQNALRSCCRPGDSLLVVDVSSNAIYRHNLTPETEDKLRKLWNRSVVVSETPVDATERFRATPASPAPASPSPAVAEPETWAQKLFGQRAA